MARPQFRQIGLRRDLNLSDLGNKDIALNNLLNDLVTTGEGETFSSADLDAIKGISNSIVDRRDLSLLAGIAVKNTVLNPETGELEDQVARPLITIKNQIDSIVLTTNDPPFFNGGDGLTAQFWNSEDIRSTLSINSNGADVVIGAPETERVFWNNGLFEFSNKLDDTLGGSNGAIQWTGWYIPDATGPSTFRFSTTGFLIVEFENEAGQLEVYKNIYQAERNIFAQESVVDSNTITVTEQQAKTVAINDEVIEIVDNNGDPVAFPEGLTVTGVGTTTVTFNQNLSLGENYRIKVSVANLLGTVPFSVAMVLPDLERYVPIRMRITYWFPGELEYFYKLLDCNLSTASKTSGDLPFWYLYTEVGNIDIQEGFKGFFDKRLLRGGGTIGPEEVNVSQQYNKFSSISPLTVRYEPPNSLAEITRATYTYNVLGLSNILSVTSTSPYTDSVEIGNYVVSPILPKFTRVSDISRNNIVVIDKLAEASATTEFDIIDHRGLIDYQFSTSAGNTVTVGTTEGLKEGMIVIGPTTNSYNRIESIISIRQITTTNPLNLNGLEMIYFYSDKGLRNNSLDNFCEGTLGKEIAVTAATGATTIRLNNVDGIAIGNVIQSSPYIPSNTAKVLSVDTNTGDVIIDTAIVEEMVQGTTVVICPSNTVLNKEACVIPLNTAPPFVGTLKGLRTTDGSGTPASKDLVIVDGDLRIRSLNVENVPAIIQLPPTGTESYDRTVEINCNGTVYKILASTS